MNLHNAKGNAAGSAVDHQAASGTGQPDYRADDLDSATGECSLLAALQARFLRIGWHLFPLYESKLYLTHPMGAHQVVPSLPAARRLLASMEGA